MKTKRLQTRVGLPPLPDVVQEMASIVESDDWVRHSTEDDGSFYYIAGVKAWTADQHAEQEFTTQSVPLPQHVSPRHEAEVHAQVASAKPTDYYVQRAMARLRSTGVDPKIIKVFVDGARGADVDWARLSGKFAFAPGTESLNAFCDLLRTLAMDVGFDPDAETEAERRQQLGVASEKLYLRELSTLYRGVVRRAGTLEALAFSDPQLNEASRCYVYGFFRATVLLSASALERCLRDAVGSDVLSRIKENAKGFYRPLIDEAARKGLLGMRQQMGSEPEFVRDSMDIFDVRNKVTHKGYDPRADEAGELLMKARTVIEFVRRAIRESHDS